VRFVSAEMQIRKRTNPRGCLTMNQSPSWAFTIPTRLMEPARISTPTMERARGIS